VNAFLLALQFLTRVPVSFQFNASNKQFGQSVLFYPFVGFIMGSLLYIVALVLNDSNPMLVAAILLTVWILITGGLHLDGLADCADAWAGGLNNRQRSLEIMKDPVIGAIGAVILFIILLLKWTALTQLLAQKQLSVLLMIPLLGRCSILILMLFADYISQRGLGEKLNQFLPRFPAKIILLGCLSASVFVIGFLPIIALLVLLYAVRAIARQRLGGMTGDVYGAAVELSETTLLISLAL